MQNQPTRNRTILPSLIVAAMAALCAGPAAAQTPSAHEVLDAALERHEQRMEKVENYTVVQEINGERNVLYYERRMVDGRPAFQVAGGSAAGAEWTSDAPSSESVNLHHTLDRLAARARLTGTERVDEHSAYVVAVDDLSDTDFGAGFGAGSGKDISFNSLKYWIDADRYVPRKMRLEGTFTTGEGHRTVTVEVTMSEYQTVDGVLYPFRTDTSTEGIMSDEQQKQMSEAMEKMQKRLDQLPPAQRKRVKRMMEKRMKEMQQNGQDAFDLTVRVRELRVNAGPPEGGP